MSLKSTNIRNKLYNPLIDYLKVFKKSITYLQYNVY